MILGGNRRMPAASTAGYQIRSRKCSSVTGPPSGAVNTSASRGRPAISTDMPSIVSGGTGTVQFFFVAFRPLPKAQPENKVTPELAALMAPGCTR